MASVYEENRGRQKKQIEKRKEEEQEMFSYEDYRQIIEIIKETGRQELTYQNALGKERFILMRHDVEYSVERAYELARVENSMDFTSTYFFQWTNNTYNILSRKNMDLIKDMHERGHQIVSPKSRRIQLALSYPSDCFIGYPARPSFSSTSSARACN